VHTCAPDDNPLFLFFFSFSLGPCRRSLALPLRRFKQAQTAIRVWLFSFFFFFFFFSLFPLPRRLRHTFSPFPTPEFLSGKRFTFDSIQESPLLPLSRQFWAPFLGPCFPVANVAFAQCSSNQTFSFFSFFPFPSFPSSRRSTCGPSSPAFLPEKRNKRMVRSKVRLRTSDDPIRSDLEQRVPLSPFFFPPPFWACVFNPKHRLGSFSPKYTPRKVKARDGASSAKIMAHPSSSFPPPPPSQENAAGHPFSFLRREFKVEEGLIPAR